MESHQRHHLYIQTIKNIFKTIFKSNFMKLSFLYCFLFLSFSIQAQERPTGMIFDPPSIRSIPYKAKLTASSYQSMPASASLEKYCPTAGDQGRYGTCVAFATAYHMRTILYAKTQREPDPDGNVSPVNANSKIFSPTYIYEHVYCQSE